MHEELHEGVLVAGKYRLVETAGEGAMGAVWKAMHLTLGHAVAIKFLHGNVAKSSEPRARFEREAKLAARLGEASRHITRVTDHGVLGDGTPYLVMELLLGEGLDTRMKREHRLPLPTIARITTQLARALYVAHQAGVIHRDLKPANVFLCHGEGDGDLFVKLLDFGVAKATLDGDDNQQTRAGALIGTPNYMSPEQITGDAAIDPRSDLWALAAIVYRMATGKAPFGSGALSELAMRIVATEPRAPTTLAPDLPPEFDLWARKGLAKLPAERFQTARELAESLVIVSGISVTGTSGTGVFSSFDAGRAAAALAAYTGADSVGPLHHTVDTLPDTPPSLPIVQSGGTTVPARSSNRRGIQAAVAIGAIAVMVAGVATAMRVPRRAEPGGSPAASPSSAEKEKVIKAPPPAPSASAPTLPIVEVPIAEPIPEDLTPDAASSKAANPRAPAAAHSVAMPSGAPHMPAVAAPAPRPTASAAPPPAAPDLKQQSGTLWQKKDEM